MGISVSIIKVLLGQRHTHLFFIICVESGAALVLQQSAEGL